MFNTKKNNFFSISVKQNTYLAPIYIIISYLLRALLFLCALRVKFLEKIPVNYQ